MSGLFAVEQFTDGTIPATEYRPEYTYSSQANKHRAANALARFLDKGCPRSLFTARVYDALNQHMFGHIAEFGIHGFYATWFSTPEARARWIEYARNGGAYGFHALEERPDLWGDVERIIVGWLNTTGVGDRLINAATDLRQLLSDLTAKAADLGYRLVQE